MESESIVYGCIRDWPSESSAESRVRRQIKIHVLAEIPAGAARSVHGREMLAASQHPSAGLYQTQVIHFGASYRSIEYEWSLWVAQFEALLKRLYWTSAVVHLETELNGTHTFRWESDNGLHSPQEGELRVRCAWEREGGLRG